MLEPRVRIRRGRRTDFSAVMDLLAAGGLPVPPADRATLKRFRNIVADLGADLYLAFDGEVALGFVHVTYTRQLTTGALAHLDQLLVADAHRRRGVGSALLQFARRRAERRGCDRLTCTLPAQSALAPFLGRHGLVASGGQWSAACIPAEASHG